MTAERKRDDYDKLMKTFGLEKQPADRFLQAYHPGEEIDARILNADPFGALSEQVNRFLDNWEAVVKVQVADIQRQTSM